MIDLQPGEGQQYERNLENVWEKFDFGVEIFEGSEKIENRRSKLI